jgi:hypothetical protein
MELLTNLFRKQKTEESKTVADYQRENLVQLGRQQFQKLKELGLGAPISLI